MKYLYGAAVQGIQEFIFQTNKLKEIVGASELVEEICTIKFESLLGENVNLADDKNAIVHAAGNIKYIFDKKETCEKIVRCFPKELTQFAPGVTVSQAVVSFEEENFSVAVKELEVKLRIQRNKPMRYPMLGLMGIERSQQTGLPVCKIKDNKHLDAATLAKLYSERFSDKQTTQKLFTKAFGKSDFKISKIPFEISDMTGKNDWMAVIHADGNGLGQIVQKIGTNPEEFKKFSEALDKVTITAAQNAYKAMNIESLPVIPIRPIVLGGDDLTVICRADLAIEYVKCFIQEFEERTKEKLGKTLKDNKVFNGQKDYLTACAGIAYIKSSFPFYYGYELAEALCSRAKADAKAGLVNGELPASCIMFHKVQDSFIEDYNIVVERELKPQDNISFEFGPYYMKSKEGRWTIEDLTTQIKKFDNSIRGNALKSGLRNWLSLIHTNVGQAEQFLERLKEVSGEYTFLKNIINKKIVRDNMMVYPVYDMLAIHSIQNQQTRKENEK